MIETLRRKGITKELIALVIASLLLVIVSLIIGLLAEFGPPGWIKALRIWALFLRLPFGIVVVIAILSLGKWILFNRESKTFIAINSSVFIASTTALFSILYVLQWIDNKAISAQFDIIEEVCQKGFTDSSTLEKYQGEVTVIGSWDYVMIWEDKSHNAIWFNSCNSLSSCGVICVRDGTLLKDSTNDYEYHEFKYIRDGLYWWD